MTKAKNILLATLGTAPAVVTEAVDLLREAGVRIDGISLFMTEDPDVQEGYALLVQHLPSHDGISWLNPVHVGVYMDIDSAQAAAEFLQVASQHLKTLRDAGYRVYVSIAGGRKAMSALLAVAVQFFGAERLFHIWVPPWLEAEGEVEELRKWKHSPEELTRKLHPTLNAEPTDRPRLVTLPVIGLFPFLEDIRLALTSQGDVPRDIRHLLRENGLLTSQGEVTDLGRLIGQVLESVEGLPPARQEECKVHIASHHYKDRLEKFAWQLCGRFPFITEIQSGEWRSGEGRIRAEPPNRIRVFKPLGTDFPLQLILTTTARTPGQLEAVRRAIERFLVSRR